MNVRDEDRYEAAVRYYIHNETMDSIARHLNVSRSSVSRLLTEARKSGIVRISITSGASSHSPIAKRLAEAFGVTVHLVAVGDAAPTDIRLERVCRLAASILTDSVNDGNKIGAAWGVTVSNIVSYLERRPLRDATIVQINGGTNAHDVSSQHVTAVLQALATAFDAHIIQFPVPAFFDYPETKAAMWRERSVRSILDIQEHLDVAIFGVGSLAARIPSYVYTAGYLDPSDMKQLKAEHVVGDVSTVLLREDGSFEDINLNKRATGLTPAQLQRIPIRIGVVADVARAPALLGALRARTITDLVCDDTTALAVLDRM